MPLPTAYPNDTHVRIRGTSPHPIDLHVRTYGQPSDPAIMLVNGIGANKESTPEKSFYQALAARKFFVVTFSNRDSGGSTKMSHLPTRSMLTTLGLAALAGVALPTAFLTLLVFCLCNRHLPGANHTAAAILATCVGFKASGGQTLPKLFSLTPVYTLNDVAEDIVLLMDQMQFPQAHIMGGSMGGMLAQIAVVNYPDRFLSLASVMSNTGANSILGLPDYPLSTLFYLYLTHPMSHPAENDLEGTIAYEAENIEFQLSKEKLKQATWNQGLTVLEEAKRRHAAHTLHDTTQSRKKSMSRQMDGIAWQQGHRAAQLSTIRIPTIVVHGMDDKLIPVASGLDTAKAIGFPACRKVVLIPGCGHSLDDVFAHDCVEAIVENCMFAERLKFSKL